MRLLADENIPSALIEFLRDSGYDVVWMAERNPGASDRQVIALASDEGRVILTADRDFGALAYRYGSVLDVPMVILLRLPWASLVQPSWYARIAKVLSTSQPGWFYVVDEKRVRARPLRP